MKAIFVAIATIALVGCTTYSYEDAQKDDLAAPPAPTPTRSTTSGSEPARGQSALAGEDEIRPSCEEKWAGEWSMIVACVERGDRKNKLRFRQCPIIGILLS
jgi:hypothetical protein